MKLIILLFIYTSSAFSAPILYGVNETERETLNWAFQKAQKFSNITSLDIENGWKKWPIFIVTEDELSRIICPDDPNNCHGLAAIYDTILKQIFIREDVHPDMSIINLSFLIHEMVHALQNETKNDDDLFGTCQKLYNTEKEAYEAQDAFLKSEGQFFRAGNALRFFICH